jgi:hypothetical protein
MWCIYTIEYYFTTKKNEAMSFVGKWIELQIIMLSKIKPDTQRKILHIFLSYVLPNSEKKGMKIKDK